MYTRSDFGKALKEKVKQKQDTIEIGCWAHDIYMQHIDDIMDNDPDLGEKVLLILTFMELGPEFTFSYERLDEIADDLIAGKKDVNMDY